LIFKNCLEIQEKSDFKEKKHLFWFILVIISISEFSNFKISDLSLSNGHLVVAIFHVMPLSCSVNMLDYYK